MNLLKTRKVKQLKKAYRMLRNLLSSDPSVHVQALLSLAHIGRLSGKPKWRRFISRKLRKQYGVFLSPECFYGINFRIKHPVGVVIGSGVKIGDNVTIFQNVTLGGRRMGDGGGEKYPSIDDGSVIFAGAVILGDVKVGKHCTVGANAVVLLDVPNGSTVVGVPARIISRSELI